MEPERFGNLRFPDIALFVVVACILKVCNTDDKAPFEKFERYERYEIGAYAFYFCSKPDFYH